MGEFRPDGLRRLPKSFYLPLISDSSSKIYSDNALSHFRVQLQEPLYLEGHWECGLAEVQVPPPKAQRYTIRMPPKKPQVRAPPAPEADPIQQMLGTTSPFLALRHILPRPAALVQMENAGSAAQPESPQTDEALENSAKRAKQDEGLAPAPQPASRQFQNPAPSSGSLVVSAPSALERSTPQHGTEEAHTAPAVPEQAKADQEAENAKRIREKEEEAARKSAKAPAVDPSPPSVPLPPPPSATTTPVTRESPQTVASLLSTPRHASLSEWVQLLRPVHSGDPTDFPNVFHMPESYENWVLEDETPSSITLTNGSKIEFSTRRFDRLTDWIQHVSTYLTSEQEVAAFVADLTTAWEEKGRARRSLIEDGTRIFIYCDVIQASLCSDFRGKLLRILPYEGVIRYQTMNPVYYYPVDKHVIDCIHVELMTKYGEYFPFTDHEQPVVVVLHFRAT